MIEKAKMVLNRLFIEIQTLMSLLVSTQKEVRSMVEKMCTVLGNA